MAEVKIETKDQALPFDQLADALQKAMTGAIATANPRREDPNVIEHSVYRPFGVKKAEFTRRYFWGGVEVEHHMITPEEAELLEGLKAGGYHQNERGVSQWNVTEQGDGKSTVVKITFPCNTSDERASLPSMKRMLREMVHGTVED